MYYIFEVLFAFLLSKSEDMQKRQVNKLSMFRRVEQLLGDNPVAISSIPALEVTKDLFSEKIAAIDLAVAEQATATTGVSRDKNKLKRQLVERLIVVAGAMGAYASQIKHNELLREVSYSRTRLLETRDELLVPLSEIIYKRAVEYSAVLADYGIAGDAIDALKIIMDDYKAKTPAPRLARVMKQAKTKLIAKTFYETDKLLKREIDKLMLWFKTSDRDLFQRYKGVRQLVNRGVTHTGLRVVASDSEGNLLDGADVLLVKNGDVFCSKRTGERGNASISRISPGVYTIRIEKEGFVPVLLQEVNFVSGKRVMRRVKLLQ